jgi:hypothetical protein
MKYSVGLAALAAAAFVLADDDTCEADLVESVNSVFVNTTTVTTTPVNTTNLFAPALAPGVDLHSITNVFPQANVSLFYGSNLTTTSSVNVNHTMKYPTVLLEQIASIITVDCSADSVVMTFNDSGVFETTQAVWIADGTVVFVTNHLGDCDPELERGFFLSRGLSFDSATLIATASSSKANISSIAGKLIILNRKGKNTDIDQLAPKSHSERFPPQILLNERSPRLLTQAMRSTLPSPCLLIPLFTRTLLT